jgi:hypothetical protein
MSAEIVSEAHRLNREAVSNHKAALGKADAIAARLQAVKTRMAEITAARVEGSATGHQHSDEFILLNADAELLQAMHRTALDQARDLEKEVSKSASHFNEAQRQHDRDLAAVEYDALHQKLVAVEAVFVRLLAATHAAGRRVGHVGLSQSWQPSQPLQRAISYGVAPTVEH